MHDSGPTQGALFATAPSEATEGDERSQGTALGSPGRDWLEDVLRRLDPRFQPVWQGRPLPEQLALARYFLPHQSAQTRLAPTRPRCLKWYCPFAAQSAFPSGHRYCLNVYTGCSHDCRYCYVNSYQDGPARAKRHLPRWLRQDLADLETFNLPPAPVHLSNSTDPFQPLEEQHGHTKLCLEGILNHRHRFTTVTVLTKNPSLAARADYVDLLRRLAQPAATHPWRQHWQHTGQPAAQVEVSLAFWREEAAAFWDPHAPTVADRLAGIRQLRQAGVPIVLRIDPLLPRSAASPHTGWTLRDFSLPEAQAMSDLECLVRFAKEVGARHVVYSPAKIVLPRGQPLEPALASLKKVYETMADPDPLLWQGLSWRLPRKVCYPWLVEPFLDLCRRWGMPAKFCKQNLIETP